MVIKREKLELWFGNQTLPDHPSKNDQPMQEIRVLGLRLAQAIVDNTPPSPDQSTAIRELRRSVQSAYQAIVCNGS